MRQPIPITVIDAVLADPDLRPCYVSPGLAPLAVEGFVPEYHVRLVLIPEAGPGALAAALAGWCEAAARVLGSEVGWLQLASLLAPVEDDPWARVSAPQRAELLAQAIACTARHVAEIAVLDLGELPDRKLLGLLRAERLRGGPAILGIGIEHLFFAMLCERAEQDERDWLALVQGSEPGFELRVLVTEQAPVWGDGLVFAPPASLAGLAMAELVEVVVCQQLALRQRPPPPALEPALAAALQAGYALLAPRLANLLPRDPGAWLQ